MSFSRTIEDLSAEMRDFTLGSWKARMIETVWRAVPRRSTDLELSWPLNREQLTSTAIRWPCVYEWPPAAKWADPLFYGLRQLVKVEKAEIPQPYSGVVLIHLAVDGRSHEVAIDYSDRSVIDEECAKRCALYFKMQYVRGGYSSAHILPGGYVPADPHLYHYVHRLRAIKERRFFLYDVYGRFGLQFAKETRTKAVQLLSQQTAFRYGGGLSIARYSTSLREAVRSKICIDLPGNGDFCFRLIDYLALGACVIARKHRTILHVPLIDREHIVYTHDDLSDLVSLCEFYLEHDDARERLCENSRNFFDKYLDRRQLAAYYLYCCLQRLN